MKNSRRHPQSPAQDDDLRVERIDELCDGRPQGPPGQLKDRSSYPIACLGRDKHVFRIALKAACCLGKTPCDGRAR